MFRRKHNKVIQHLMMIAILATGLIASGAVSSRARNNLTDPRQERIPVSAKLSLQSSIQPGANGRNRIPLSRTDPANSFEGVMLSPAISLEVTFADGSKSRADDDYQKDFASNVIFDDTSGDRNDLIKVVYWWVDRSNRQRGKYASQLTSTGNGVGSAYLKVSFRNAPDVTASVHVEIVSGAGEEQFWDAVKNSQRAGDFQEYLKNYPNGKYAAIARQKVNPQSGQNSPEQLSKQVGDKKLPVPCALNGVSGETQSKTSNKYGIEFMQIPEGRFMMGGTLDNERPVHEVTIRSFCMGKYEVTQAQWQAVMGSNPSDFRFCGGNCPVERVSWNDAQDFIKKLNELNDGMTYRLPTEAEWEYACRAGTTGDYAGNLSEMAWDDANSRDKTHAVGGKRPNDWGLADMHGNVWEWCEDWYHSTYDGAPTDGSAWLSGGKQKYRQKYRVLRGGGWYDSAANLRSAFRNDDTPVNRFRSYGVRVVAVPR